MRAHEAIKKLQHDYAEKVALEDMKKNRRKLVKEMERKRTEACVRAARASRMELPISQRRVTQATRRYTRTEQEESFEEISTFSSCLYEETFTAGEFHREDKKICKERMIEGFADKKTNEGEGEEQKENVCRVDLCMRRGEQRICGLVDLSSKKLSSGTIRRLERRQRDFSTSFFHRGEGTEGDISITQANNSLLLPPSRHDPSSSSHRLTSFGKEADRQSLSQNLRDFSSLRRTREKETKEQRATASLIDLHPRPSSSSQQRFPGFSSPLQSLPSSSFSCERRSVFLGHSSSMHGNRMQTLARDKEDQEEEEEDSWCRSFPPLDVDRREKQDCFEATSSYPPHLPYDRRSHDTLAKMRIHHSNGSEARQREDERDCMPVFLQGESGGDDFLFERRKYLSSGEKRSQKDLGKGKQKNAEETGNEEDDVLCLYSERNHLRWRREDERRAMIYERREMSSHEEEEEQARCLTSLYTVPGKRSQGLHVDHEEYERRDKRRNREEKIENVKQENAREGKKTEPFLIREGKHREREKERRRRSSAEEERGWEIDVRYHGVRDACGDDSSSFLDPFHREEDEDSRQNIHYIKSNMMSLNRLHPFYCEGMKDRGEEEEKRTGFAYSSSSSFSNEVLDISSSSSPTSSTSRLPTYHLDPSFPTSHENSSSRRRLSSSPFPSTFRSFANAPLQSVQDNFHPYHHDSSDRFGYVEPSSSPSCFAKKSFAHTFSFAKLPPPSSACFFSSASSSFYSSSLKEEEKKKDTRDSNALEDDKHTIACAPGERQSFSKLCSSFSSSLPVEPSHDNLSFLSPFSPERKKKTEKMKCTASCQEEEKEKAKEGEEEEKEKSRVERRGSKNEMTEEKEKKKKHSTRSSYDEREMREGDRNNECEEEEETSDRCERVKDDKRKKKNREEELSTESPSSSVSHSLLHPSSSSSLSFYKKGSLGSTSPSQSLPTTTDTLSSCLSSTSPSLLAVCSSSLALSRDPSSVTSLRVYTPRGRQEKEEEDCYSSSSSLAHYSSHISQVQKTSPSFVAKYERREEEERRKKGDEEYKVEGKRKEEEKEDEGRFIRSLFYPPFMSSLPNQRNEGREVRKECMFSSSSSSREKGSFFFSPQEERNASSIFTSSSSSLGRREDNRQFSSTEDHSSVSSFLPSRSSLSHLSTDTSMIREVSQTLDKGEEEKKKSALAFSDKVLQEHLQLAIQRRQGNCAIQKREEERRRSREQEREMERREEVVREREKEEAKTMKGVTMVGEMQREKEQEAPKREAKKEMKERFFLSRQDLQLYVSSPPSSSNRDDRNHPTHQEENLTPSSSSSSLLSSVSPLADETCSSSFPAGPSQQKDVEVGHSEGKQEHQGNPRSCLHPKRPPPLLLLAEGLSTPLSSSLYSSSSHSCNTSTSQGSLLWISRGETFSTPHAEEEEEQQREKEEEEEKSWEISERVLGREEESSGRCVPSEKEENEEKRQAEEGREKKETVSRGCRGEISSRSISQARSVLLQQCKRKEERRRRRKSSDSVSCRRRLKKRDGKEEEEDHEEANEGDNEETGEEDEEEEKDIE
ncbi:hypothetical protein CSUI_002901 [Cystoisospora suis]|uniref:Uncharacterized protein n=1 Tax=Cystoisospora suis TaxID=483139 RepID=A0A2C6L719_9APIC|nr:hypothetical protein CSUI_002901 [Cystoisospora suis]